jgi:hypothetical protein
MNRICAALCVAALAVPAIATAADAPGCDTVNIGQEVLAQFPNIKSTCQKVKERDGGIYILFIGEIVSVTKEDMTVRVKDRSGKEVSELKLGLTPGQSLKVNGKDEKFSDLKRGDQLDFWIEHEKWGLYSKPGAAALNILSRKEL